MSKEARGTKRQRTEAPAEAKKPDEKKQEQKKTAGPPPKGDYALLEVVADWDADSVHMYLVPLAAITADLDKAMKNLPEALRNEATDAAFNAMVEASYELLAGEDEGAFAVPDGVAIKRVQRVCLTD